MSAWIDKALEPVSDETPVGTVRDTPERQEIEAAFETSFAIAGIAPEKKQLNAPAPIDFRHILRLIKAELGHTKDVWLGVYVAQAGLRLNDLEVTADGLALTAGLVERYWPDVFPDLVDGSGARRNACAQLGAAGFVRALQALTLLADERLGRFSGSDLQGFVDEGATAPRYGEFRLALENGGGEGLAASAGRLERMRGGFKALEAVFAAQLEGEPALTFPEALAAIDTLLAALAAFGAGEPATAAEAATDAGAPQAGGGATSRPGGRSGGDAAAAPGRIGSRDDVLRAFEAVSAYYAQHEPGSPVPLILQRARSWVSMSFLDVLNDISPDSVDQAKRVLVQRSKTVNSDSND